MDERRAIEEQLEDMPEDNGRMFEVMESYIDEVEKNLDRYPVESYGGMGLTRGDVAGPIESFGKMEKLANRSGVDTRKLYRELQKVCQPHVDAFHYWRDMRQAEAEA